MRNENMENPEKNQSSEKEKPSILYHGSPRGEIEEFESRVSKGSGEKYGAFVYASPDLATASIFMIGVEGGWLTGRLGDVPYVLIPMPRDEFIKNDRGGYVYVLPSDTFNTEADRGLLQYEWASKEKVKPVQKLEYSSALDTMLENGIQVYFVDKDTYQKFKESKDHGHSKLIKIDSENKRRNINVKL